jgi:hypothetical protein
VRLPLGGHVVRRRAVRLRRVVHMRLFMNRGKSFQSSSRFVIGA